MNTVYEVLDDQSFLLYLPSRSRVLCGDLLLEHLLPYYADINTNILLPSFGESYDVSQSIHI